MADQTWAKHDRAPGGVDRASKGWMVPCYSSDGSDVNLGRQEGWEAQRSAPVLHGT